MTPALRIAFSVALLLFALVEAVRFFALAVVPGFVHVLVEHGVLAVLAGLAGFSLLVRAPWAPTAILALGVVFAGVLLLDALVLGIRPWLFALLGAAAALIVAFLLAASTRRERRGLT